MHTHPIRPLMLAVCLTLGAGCASGIRQLDTTGATRLTLAGLKDAAQGKRLGAALQGGGKVVVHVKAGERIPLRLSSRLGPLVLEAGPQNALRCERDVYVYIGGREVLLGPDGRRWARVGDWRALKKLFGMRRGGSFRVGFGARKGEGAAVEVVVDSN